MDSERNDSPLADELAALEAARAADRAAERRQTVATRCVAATLFLVVGVFALVNYLHIKSEWTQEKLELSLRQELGMVEEVASAQLEVLGEHLLPVYADESMRQFQELSPEIARRFVEQFERLGVDLQAETRAQLVETEERILQRTTQLLADTFPGVVQEAPRAELERRLHRHTGDAVGEALTRFDARFNGEVVELQEVVLSFDVADSDEPTVELQKRFLRCWLQLLDKEIEKL